MFRYFFLISLITHFSLSQESSQLRDSILKYKTSNPSLAVEYGLEYDKLTANSQPDSEKQNTFALIGEILIEMGLNVSALDYLNRSVELYATIKKSEKNFPNIDQPPWVLLNIGSIYFKNGDYKKATEKYNYALNLFEKVSNQNAKFLGYNTSKSNLGLIKEAQGNYKEAEIIYEEIYQRRLEKGKIEDILYSMAQIIAVKLLQGEELAAHEKLKEAQSIFKKHETKDPNSMITRNWGYAHFVFAAYYQSIKKYDSALASLTKSKEILKSFPSELHVLGSRFAECYLGLNQLAKAEQVAKENLNIKNLNDAERKYNFKVLEKIYKQKNLNSELLKVKDSLILISSGSSTSKLFKTLNTYETQIQLANTAREINESKIKYNTYLYILIICSLILFFSLVTIRINYNLQKEKGDKLQVEKELITSQLEEKNRELVSKTNFIIQRNDYLKKIKKKIETPKKDITLNRLSKELTMVINSEKTYEEFDKMFVKVYPDFYAKLNALAQLSQTDLRLASYIKMNHTNNEISGISGISLRTVESQRYRLSKKLNLLENQNLNSFIMEV